MKTIKKQITKWVVLFAPFTLFITSHSNAQDKSINVSGSISIPTGALSTASSVGLLATGNYLFPVAEKVEAGPMVGLQMFLGKGGEEQGGPGAALLPIGGTARLSFEKIFVGSDIGFGFMIKPTSGVSGVYFRPQAGYYLNSIVPGMTALISYSSFSLMGMSVGGLNLGVEFSLESFIRE